MAPARDDLSHIHRPVLVKEVLAYLFAEDAASGAPPAVRRLVVDGTVGMGGHAEAILQARDDVEVLGLDRDPAALAIATKRLEAFGSRVRLVHASYEDLEQVLRDHEEEAPASILLDLGASSLQLDDPKRGFSFRESSADADMRFDPTSDGPTALELVNTWSERELARILHEFGDEPRSRQVARALVGARPIRDGAHLVEIVRRSAFRARRNDPATRTYQALRIAVNDELGHLERGLRVQLRCIAMHGRVVAISFHSGEDRRVKNAFRDAAREGVGRVLTKKPVRSTEQEARQNRRARPARLRAFERGGAGSDRAGTKEANEAS